MSDKHLNDEYISREAAKQALKPLVHEEDDYADGLHFSDIWEEECDALDALPAADVAPVVHAHWAKEYTLGWYDGEQNYKLICPACNYSYLDNHLGAIAPKHFNYCPNCGAKMDEEVDK